VRQAKAPYEAERDYYDGLRKKYSDIPSLSDADYDFLEAAQPIINNMEDPEEARDRIFAAAFYANALNQPVDVAYQNLDVFHEQWTGRKFIKKTGIQAVIDSFGVSFLAQQQNYLAIQYHNSGQDPEVLKELQEVNKKIENLRDNVPKIWQDEYIKQGGIEDVLAFFRSITTGAAENTVPIALAIGAGTLAATGVGAIAGAAALPAGLSQILVAGAGAIAAAETTALSTVGTEYYDLISQGIPDDIAWTNANISAQIQGAIEALGTGVVSKTSKEIIRALAPKAASKAASRWFIKGKMNLGAKALLEYLQETAGEGFEEGAQQGVSIGLYNRAAEESNQRRDELIRRIYEEPLEDTRKELEKKLEKYPEIDMKEFDEAWKEIKEAVIGGIGTALILGGGGAALGFRNDIQAASALADMATKAPSEAAFMEAVEKAEAEGFEMPASGDLKTDEKTALLSDIYKVQQERMTPEQREAKQKAAQDAEALAEVTDYSNADVEDIPELDEQGRPTGNTAPELFTNTEGDIYRENGNLETAEYVDEAEGGGIEGRFVAGDPRRPEADGNRYGYINYTEKDDTVTIDEFKMIAGYENLRGDLYRQFAEAHAGQNIVWNPKNEGNITLREEIAASNPRGPKYELNYFEDAGQAPASAEAARAARRFTPYLKNATPLETTLAIETFGAFYRRRGESLDGAMNRLIGGVTNKAPDAVVAAQRTGKIVKGATWLEQTAEGMKRIVYFSKNAADSSTVVHEVSHAVAMDFTEAERGIAARALNGYRLKNGTTVSFDENSPWTDEQHEAFAEALENYLTNGTAPNEEIKGLFERIKEFMKRIYQTMKGWTELSPEVERFYQSLLSGELADQARGREGRDAHQESRSEAQTEKTQNDTAKAGLTPQENAKAQRREAVIVSPDVSPEDKARAVMDAAGDALFQAAATDPDEDPIGYLRQNAGGLAGEFEADKERILADIDTTARLYPFETNQYKAPNGKQSKLNRAQWYLVRTPAFKEWFGDWENYPGQASKIVDENGEPLVVYHSGTFDEQEDIPLEDMHFGSRLAAEERHTHKAILEHVLGIEAYEDEDGNWQWIDTLDDLSSEDMGLSYKTKEAALKAANQNIADRADEILNGILEDEPNITATFLSISNPKIETDQGEKWDEAIDKAKNESHDGIIYINKFEDKGSTSYIAFKSTQIKSINNVGTFDTDNPSILFQTGDRDMMEEAAGFEDGKDYRGYIETFSGLPKEVEGFTDEQIDAWFDEYVKKAKQAVNSTEQGGGAAEDARLTPAEQDAEFIEIVSEPAALDKFLEAVKQSNNEGYDNWQGMDEGDAAERDRQKETSDRVREVMTHPMWKTFFIKKGEITEGHKKRLLGLIRNYPREYRAVYAEVMNRPDLAVSAEDTTAAILKHRIGDSRKVDIDSLTPEKLSQLAEQLDIEEYAEKVRNGKAKFDDEIERKYIKQLETRRREAEKALEEVEADREDDNRFIERQAGKQFADTLERALKARGEMSAVKGKLDRAIRNNQKDAGRIARQAARSKATYDGIMETLDALARAHQLEIDVREALSEEKLKDYAKSAKTEATLLARLARKAGASEARVRLAELKEKNDTLKALSDARRKVIKRTYRAINPREVNAEQGMAIAVIQRLAEPSMLQGIDRIIGGIEKPYLRSIFETWKTDELFREGILRDNKKSSREKIKRLFGKDKFDDLTAEEKKYLYRHMPRKDWATAMGLEEIIERRNLAFPMAGAEDAQRIAFKHLPADVYYRMMDKPYSEWTLKEIEELAKIIDDLTVQGKEIRKANLAAEKKRIREYQNAIRETILAVPFWKRKLLSDSGDTPEERARKEAGAEKITGKYKEGRKTPSYADMGIRRYAKMLDNGDPEGKNSALMVRRKDDAYNQKMAAIDERTERIQKRMKEIGIKEGELWETAAEIDLGGDMGKTGFTNGKLIGIVSASRNEYSRDAAIYGSLLTEAERGMYQYEGISDAELAPLLAVAEERYGKVMKAAEKLLAEKPQYQELMDAIDEDFTANGQRVNEALVRYNNKFMPVEEFYFPINRKAPVTSHSADTDLKRALMGGSGGAFNLFVEKGFTEGRTKIPPQYQTEIELNILSVFAQAVNREEHFMAYGQLVKDLNQIYKDSRQVRDAIQRRYGRGAVKYIDSYINRLANPEGEKTRTSIDNWIRTMRGNTAAAYLGLNVASIVKQAITSPAPFFGYMNPLEYTAALLDFSTHYTERWGEIQELSKYMKHRSPNLLVDIVKKNAGREGMNKIETAVSRFNEKSLIGLELVDRFCVAPGWYALFKERYKALTEDPNNANMSEKDIRVKAVQYADDITNLIQPNANPEELAPMFREGGELQKALLQFQSALSPIWQTFRYDIPQQIHDKRYWNAAGTVIGYSMSAIIVGALFTGFDDDDDEETKALKLAFWAGTSFTDAIPVIGAEVTQATEAIITGGRTSYRGGLNLFPTLRKGADMVSNAARGIHEGDFDKLLKASATALEALFMAKGLPVSGPKQIGRVIGIGDGDGELGFNPGAVSGRR
jgi:hypothetical protein